MSQHILLPHPGLSTGIGYYLSGMEEVRAQVVNAVKEIPDNVVYTPAFLGAHSIGGLVLHIGEAEWFWMQMVVSGQKLTDEVRQSAYWDVLEEPEALASKGYTTDLCLQEIEKIRNQTRDVLFSKNDADLDQVINFERRGKTTEHSLRWILHHLMDHEAQHKGQILMLKRIMALT